MKAKIYARPAYAVVAIAAILAGCSSVSLDDKAKVPVETRQGNTVTAPPQGQTPQSQVANVDLTRQGAGTNTAAQIPRVVLFDFDSYVVKDEFRPVIDANAKMLASDKRAKVAIEGHTDERGGREYNLALGQKRAEAVAKSISLLGAADNQMEPVSFGKERPAATGNDEAAWAQNRRAEIVRR